MKPDITAFGLGALSCIVGTLALWASFTTIDWAWVGRAAPVALIVVGIVMLILSRKKNPLTRQGKEQQ